MINKSMEVWWKCNQCDAINNYLETKTCEVCDEPIGEEDETKCIYKVANILYHSAVSAEDFTEVSDYFSKIPHYADSAQKCKACVQKAQKILMDEKKYAEANQHWGTACNLEESGSLANAEKEYALAERQFREIIPFKESRLSWMKCQQARNNVHQKWIYCQADDFFMKASTIENYQNAARLFSEIADFSDAKVKCDQCLKRIGEIKIEQQYQEVLEQKTLAEKETDLDKQASLYLGLINSFDQKTLSVKAQKLVEQCKASYKQCLDQIEDRHIQELLKKASAQCEEADRLFDYLSRSAAFSKILDEYKDYAETKQFKQLVGACRNKLEAAINNIAYDAAVALMNKADSERDFSDAAAAFSVLSGFKDSDEKKAMCTNRAEECRRRDMYNSAIEQINRSKKITIFSWWKGHK